jgi:AraC-like DNA-binding protein
MESDRCITMVKSKLNKLGVSYKSVDLGEVELSKNVSKEKLELIDLALRDVGFELMGDKKSSIVEMITAAIHQWTYFLDTIPKPNFSDYISKKVNRDYTYLSNLFTDVQGITIEKYIISQKIERVKEMIVYDELSLSDIAFRLQYSSVAHLSTQFKKVTGLTPSSFKQLRNMRHGKI